jgi:hypothetical protein
MAAVAGAVRYLSVENAIAGFLGRSQLGAAAPASIRHDAARLQP